MAKWLLFPVFFLFIILKGNSQNIVKAEYFWDSDPGVGSGINIPIPVPSTNVKVIASISAAGLNQGFHLLYTRSKDAGGRWGLFDGTLVYVSAPALNKIVQMEYFWDSDPGPGNAIGIPIGTPAANLTLIPSFSAAGLSAGIHNLYVRARDFYGKWGLFDKSIVCIIPPTSSNIVKLEYFWDSDPGVGNGTSLTPVSPGLIVNENFSILAPNSLSQGNHILAIRSRNALGVWSLFQLDTITISGILPLQMLVFTGKKDTRGIYLEWITDHEFNTDYFEVERSINSVSFSSLGTIKSANYTGTNKYHFIDSQPLPGVNFYRLKQTDNDKKFTYSKVIRILNTEEAGVQFQLLPNPAQKQITIYYGGKEKAVMINIYDVQGRLAEQLTQENHSPLIVNIGHLQHGIYFILLSDGIKREYGKFLKN